MKLNVLAQTKKRLQNQTLYNAEQLRDNKHINMFDRLELEYIEAVHDELEILNTLGKAIKDFDFKDDKKDALIVKFEIKGKSDIKRIADWLYEQSR